MRIAFELTYYAPGARGPYLFGRNMARALGALSPDDEFFVFDYFYSRYREYRARFEALAAPNVRIAVHRWPQRAVDFLERRLGYPFVDSRFLAAEGIDVFFHGSLHPIDTRRTASVFYVHGIPMDLLGLRPHFEKEVVARILAATRVVTPSRCSRDFLLKHYDIAPDRVSVVHYGVDHELFKPISDRGRLDSVRGRYNLPEEFLLCVGPFQFRDNVEHLLRTLGDDDMKGAHLALAGGLEEHGPVLVDRVRRLGLADRVHFTGHVPQEDLAALYNLASLFVHSSYYEELGAQNLEAAACGAPLLVSQAGGIPEATGDAAVYFSPYLIDEFKATLKELLENSARREEMRRRSLEWSRRFSWEKSARQLLEILHAAALAR